MIRVKSYFNYIYSYPDDCVKDNDIDASGKVFYVGKGTDTRRIDNHLREASKGCQCQKCQEIRWIWSLNKAPVRQIVFNTMSEQEAFTNEKHLIQVVYCSEFLTNILLAKSAVAQEQQAATLLMKTLSKGLTNTQREKKGRTKKERKSTKGRKTKGGVVREPMQLSLDIHTIQALNAMGINKSQLFEDLLQQYEPFIEARAALDVYATLYDELNHDKK